MDCFMHVTFFLSHRQPEVSSYFLTGLDATSHYFLLPGTFSLPQMISLKI